MRQLARLFLLFLLPALLLAAPVAMAAPEPDERLQDEELEVRARALYRQLRCVVCQSQSIDESNAPLAADMRAVVRERLLTGDSVAEVSAWLQTRCGDYVLMMPPLQGNTILLWFFPVIAFLIGGTLIVLFVRGQSGRAAPALNPDEEAELARLREEEGQS